jgi:hypothetical protein
MNSEQIIRQNCVLLVIGCAKNMTAQEIVREAGILSNFILNKSTADLHDIKQQKGKKK